MSHLFSCVVFGRFTINQELTLAKRAGGESCRTKHIYSDVYENDSTFSTLCFYLVNNPLSKQHRRRQPNYNPRVQVTLGRRNFRRPLKTELHLHLTNPDFFSQLGRDVIPSSDFRGKRNAALWKRGSSVATSRFGIPTRGGGAFPLKLPDLEAVNSDVRV